MILNVLKSNPKKKSSYRAITLKQKKKDKTKGD